MSRTFWFLAGSVSGVYAVVKAKRTAQNFTPDGVAARMAAFRAGARVFTDEVNAGRVEREADLLAELQANSGAHRRLEPLSVDPRVEPVLGEPPGVQPARPSAPAMTPELAESTPDGHR